jgi:hypothetical protein
LAIVALTDKRLGECLLPLRRKCDQRQIAALTRVLRAELTRQVLSPADREGTSWTPLRATPPGPRRSISPATALCRSRGSRRSTASHCGW